MSGQIPIKDAEKIGKSRGLPLIVVFGITEDGSRFEVTTWGRNRKLCKLAASFGDQFAEAIFDGRVVPPAHEAEYEELQRPVESVTEQGRRRCRS